MTTYTDEVNVYNPEAIASGIADAGDTADKYITAVDQNGIKVHAVSNTTTNYAQINANGMDVVNGGDSIANFGASARVGKSDESHVDIDYHSLQLVDKNASIYFYVSDLRDQNGVATVSQTFYGDGSKKYFTLGLFAASNDYSVTVGDGSGGSVTKGPVSINFETAPSDGTTITVEYTTASGAAKAYTIGRRNTNSEVGLTTVGPMSCGIGNSVIATNYISYAEGEMAESTGKCSHAEGSHTKAVKDYSHAEGDRTIARGEASHAEGSQTEASGGWAHAEGSGTIASGYNSHAECFHTESSGYASHAEGSYTVASGTASHAQNWYTIASGQAQTAIGTFNVEDTASGNGTYALIIGNGESESTRSNALAVEWSGHIVLANNTQLWDNTGAVTHLLTPANASNKQAEFTFEPDGNIYRRTSTDSGSNWSGWQAIGAVKTTDISSATSIATSTYKSIGSISLEAGTWVIAYGGQFASNSTGVRAAFIYTSQNVTASAAWNRESLVQSAATPSGQTYLRGTCIVAPTATTTYYLTLWHNAGSAINCYGNIKAIRIG